MAGAKTERTSSVHPKTIALRSGEPGQEMYTVRPGKTVPRIDSGKKVELDGHSQQQNFDAIELGHEVQHPSISKRGKCTAGRRRAPDAEHDICHLSMENALRVWNARTGGSRLKIRHGRKRPNNQEWTQWRGSMTDVRQQPLSSHGRKIFRQSAAETISGSCVAWV